MLNKLERKFGNYAIPNLIVYLLGGYVIGYLLYFGSLNTDLNFISFMTLEPYQIIHNFQIWRLITWVMIPPSNSSLIFAFIMMVFYYQLGMSLERTIGTFRFNVFIFGGMFFTVVGAFILYALVSVGVVSSLYGATLIGSAFSTNYINMSIFLAFAMCYPRERILLFFIIPIEMRWLAIVYAGLTLLNVFSGSWAIRIAIISSLLNVVIFFFSTHNMKRVDPREIHRRKAFKKATTMQWEKPNRSGQQVSRHKCAICGRTELTNPELEFRFCSKCNGNYEYCQDHLFTHQHVK